MRVFGLDGEFERLVKGAPVKISETAQTRLRLLSAWQALQEQGLSSQQASERLGMSRATLYRWQVRLKKHGPAGLEVRSRRPKRLRTPRWDERLVEAVRELRQLYPRWGKEKLLVLLAKEGFSTSASTVGRILAYLKRRGQLPDPLQYGVKVRKKHPSRLYAVRKPRDYPVQSPGDLVQVDTLDVSLPPGLHFKHFTARDVVSRWDVLEAHPKASAACAKAFLTTLLNRTPFPIKAVQVDGGSEFKADFELACHELGLSLFILPPRSPKLNGCVERAHRTHLDEFYRVYDCYLDLDSLNAVLSDWERIYNRVRPHRSLDNLTPAEYIQRHFPDLSP